MRLQALINRAVLPQLRIAGDTVTIINSLNSLVAFILMNNSELQVQARKVLDTIAFMPFEQCQPLTRSFDIGASSYYYQSN